MEAVACDGLHDIKGEWGNLIQSSVEPGEKRLPLAFAGGCFFTLASFVLALTSRDAFDWILFGFLFVLTTLLLIATNHPGGRCRRLRPVP